MDYFHLDILKFSIAIWIVINSCYFFGAKLLFYQYETVAFIGATFIGLHFLRIRQPDKKLVNEVLGRDPLDEDDGSFFIKTVSHRGCGLDAPENTLAAFQYSASKGFQMIEFDLSMTKDYVPIIFHDYDLKRLTGSCALIKKTNWNDLKDIDIAQRHPLKERFPNTRIPTFEETIDFCLKNNIKMIIDLKDNDKETIDLILNTFKNKKEMYKNAVVSGFNPFLLYRIRRGDPKIVCSIAYRDYYFSYILCTGPEGPTKRVFNNYFSFYFYLFLDYLWKQCFFWSTRIIGVSMVLLFKDMVNQETARYWRLRNIRLMAWTVNQPWEKHYFAKGVKVTYLTDTWIGESTVHGENKTDSTVSSSENKPLENGRTSNADSTVSSPEGKPLENGIKTQENGKIS